MLKNSLVAQPNQRRVVRYESRNYAQGELSRQRRPNRSPPHCTPVCVPVQEPAISHPQVYSTTLWKKKKPTIVSVKGIPTIYTSNLLRAFEQPSVPSECAEIELGGRDDDVKEDRYDQKIYDTLAQGCDSKQQYKRLTDRKQKLMFPPRSDYSQEHRQRKGRDPHHKRMPVESKISDNFPSRRIKGIGREARADCESGTFETNTQETHIGDAHMLGRRQIPRDTAIRNRRSTSSKRGLPRQYQKNSHTPDAPIE